MAYICSMCGNKFATKYTLNRHSASIHGTSASSTLSEEDMSEMSGEEAPVESQQAPTEDEEVESDDSASTVDLEEAKYPWQELTDAIVDQFRSKVNRRIETYRREGYHDQEALAESYADFEDKMLSAARNYFYDLVKKKTALENDSMYESIITKMEQLSDKEGMDDKEAWRLAIKKKDFLLEALLPKKEHFEENEDETDDIDDS